MERYKKIAKLLGVTVYIASLRWENRNATLEEKNKFYEKYRVSMETFDSCDLMILRKNGIKLIGS